MSVHQRKGVIGQSGPRAGDKAAGGNRQSDQRDQRLGRAPPYRCNVKVG